MESIRQLNCAILIKPLKSWLTLDAFQRVWSTNACLITVKKVKTDIQPAYMSKPSQDQVDCKLI